VDLAHAGCSDPNRRGHTDSTGLSSWADGASRETDQPGPAAAVDACADVGAELATEDKFASAMQPFGGTVLKTSLSDSDERELVEELSGQS